MIDDQDQDALESLQRLTAKLWHRHHVTEPPVQIFDITRAEAAQVVFTRALPEGVPGLLYFSSGGPVVFIQAADCVQRQRFACAHELYHLLHADKAAVPLHVSYERFLEADGAPWEERKANRFAAELLMPAPWLEYMVREGETFADLMQIYEVSESALSRRFGELGLRRLRTLDE